MVVSLSVIVMFLQFSFCDPFDVAVAVIIIVVILLHHVQCSESDKEIL